MFTEELGGGGGVGFVVNRSISQMTRKISIVVLSLLPTDIPGRKDTSSISLSDMSTVVFL